MKILVPLVMTAGICGVLGRVSHADVYDDAKDIIRELVERDIASEAIPNAAAKIDLLCDYFPSSLAALQALRFNGLPEVIHKEVADAIGFRLLVKFSPPPKVDKSNRQPPPIVPFYLSSDAGFDARPDSGSGDDDRKAAVAGTGVTDLELTRIDAAYLLVSYSFQPDSALSTGQERSWRWTARRQECRARSVHVGTARK